MDGIKPERLEEIRIEANQPSTLPITHELREIIQELLAEVDWLNGWCATLQKQIDIHTEQQNIRF